jgi:hypothetical protein
MLANGAGTSTAFPHCRYPGSGGKRRHAIAKNHPAGWVFLDVLSGLLIVALLAATLGAAAAARERALHHLADTRAAMRAAESALISLQSGDTRPAEGVAIRRLPDVSPNPLSEWVQVRATVNGREAQLVGLVPKGRS